MALRKAEKQSTASVRTCMQIVPFVRITEIHEFGPTTVLSRFVTLLSGPAEITRYAVSPRDLF